MRGRKPIPTTLKVLAGNPGKKRLPQGEPQPDPGIPDAPPCLDGYARAEWDTRAGALAALDSFLLRRHRRVPYTALAEYIARNRGYERQCG